MDGASWHQEYLDKSFSNLSIIHTPPYSPELNPIEQVWSWMRQNKITNRVFNSYEDIVNKCITAWCILIATSLTKTQTITFLEGYGKFQNAKI